MKCRRLCLSSQRDTSVLFLWLLREGNSEVWNQRRHAEVSTLHKIELTWLPNKWEQTSLLLTTNFGHVLGVAGCTDDAPNTAKSRSIWWQMDSNMQ